MTFGKLRWDECYQVPAVFIPNESTTAASPLVVREVPIGDMVP